LLRPNLNKAPLSSNAPKDKPFNVKEGGFSKFDSLIAPYVHQARKTLPEAKKQFLSGLNKGEVFFLVIRI